ncbi:hypothetical protein [Hungatella effluvii]|nr:hypothetical protein [Hungatella effluvii]
MKRHRKHPLPSLAEAEKQRFRRLLRQKPAPCRDRPAGRKNKRKRPIRRP